MSPAMRAILVALFVSALSLSACGPSAAPVTAEVVTMSVATPTTVASVPPVTLKVATYNILNGAGIGPALDQFPSDGLGGTDRTALLTEYLRGLDADIVGLQETTGWDQGTPPYIETLAGELGMNYVVSTGRSDSSLLTKFDLLDAQDLSDETTSIIRATLLGPDGNPINVYVAHLNSASSEERNCSIQFLLGDSQRFTDQRTFLLGDMNFKGRGDTEWGPNALREAGWQLLAVDNHLRFDQVWAPPSLEWQATAWTPNVGDQLSQISDHKPAGLELTISSPSGPEAPSVDMAPTAMAAVPDMPEQVAAGVTNARLAFSQQEGVPCNQQRWNPYSSNSNIVGIDMHLYGEHDWASYASWSRRVSESEGMLLDFRYEPESEFNIFLEHSEWGSPDFRKFGMVVGNDGRLHVDWWDGDNSPGNPDWNGSATLLPDTWYRLLLVVGPQGRLGGYIWPVDGSAEPASYDLAPVEDWQGLDWRLATGANSGGIDIHAVSQVVFDPAP